YEPSGRRRSFAVRTTTALTTSPFLTPPPGRASLTEPTTTSPTCAYRRPLPPSTRITRTSLAPVLSATLQRDSCWITYLALSTISTTRQRLVLEVRRVSISRTVSPTCASFVSSWAASLFERATVFLYSGCRTRRSIRTPPAQPILSDPTTPTRILRRVRSPAERSGGGRAAAAGGAGSR